MPVLVEWIIAGTVVFVVLGRALFGRWFNHFSLYAAIWGTALALFEMQLITYYPIEPEAWTVILGGSAAFFLGAATVCAYRFAFPPGRPPAPAPSPDGPGTQKLLVRILWGLNIVTLLTVLQHWYVMSKIAGGVARVVILANVLYSFRMEYGIPGGIPYVKSLALCSALLGGVHIAATGRMRLAGIMPLVIIFLGEVVAVGRAMLIMGTILFMCGYFFYRATLAGRSGPSRAGARMKRILTVLLVLALILAGMDFIRSSRGSNESLAGASRSLEKTRGAMFFTPTVFLYVSSNFGVLNQYLKQDREPTPWGGNTFLPFYRFLTRLGSTTVIPQYPLYYRTPTRVNAGTYLRELHADFGMAGVIIYPYILGLLTSAVWFALRARFRYLVLTLLGFLYAFIAMSLFYGLTRAGEYLIGGVAGLVLGRLLDKRAETATSLTGPP